MDKMFFDDLLDICFVNVAVPDPLRVDHGDRSFRAAVEAPRLIYAHATRTVDSPFLDQLLCIFA